jgi:hypothetical protein
MGQIAALSHYFNEEIWFLGQKGIRCIYIGDAFAGCFSYGELCLIFNRRQSQVGSPGSLFCVRIGLLQERIVSDDVSTDAASLFTPLGTGDKNRRHLFVR